MGPMPAPFCVSPTGRLLPGHAAAEAGPGGLELPHNAAGLPRPAQLHGPRQAQGESLVPHSPSWSLPAGSGACDALGALSLGSLAPVPGFRRAPHPLPPQVRKAAQHGICSVLKGSECLFGDAAPEHHPAACSTAKFCVQEIEKAGGEGLWEVGRGLWGLGRGHRLDHGLVLGGKEGGTGVGGDNRAVGGTCLQGRGSGELGRGQEPAAGHVAGRQLGLLRAVASLRLEAEPSPASVLSSVG